MPPDRLEDLLPWRAPFLCIDRLVECTPHRSITTLKQVSADDMLGPPPDPTGTLWPGLLALEGMNQSAALLFRLSHGAIARDRLPLLGHLRARFPGQARPGDTILFEVHAVKMTRTQGLFEGIARVEGRAIVEGELSLAVAPLGEVR